MQTDREVAKAAGTSHDTVAKVNRISEKAVPEVVAALRANEISIHAAAKLARLKHGGDRKSDQAANLPLETTQSEAADSLNVSPRSVRDARAIEREMWLACHTQQEIAEAVGMTQKGVDLVLEETAGLPNLLKLTKTEQACHTQQEIAEKVGMTQPAVVEVLSETADTDSYPPFPKDIKAKNERSTVGKTARTDSSEPFQVGLILSHPPVA